MQLEAAYLIPINHKLASDGGMAGTKDNIEVYVSIRINVRTFQYMPERTWTSPEDSPPLPRETTTSPTESQEPHTSVPERPPGFMSLTERVSASIWSIRWIRHYQ